MQGPLDLDPDLPPEQQVSAQSFASLGEED